MHGFMGVARERFIPTVSLCLFVEFEVKNNRGQDDQGAWDEAVFRFTVSESCSSEDVASRVI